MSDYISDEIEDLEERLGVYLKGLGGHPGRDTLLSKKIKNMEKQLDILKKAKAFDEVHDIYRGFVMPEDSPLSDYVDRMSLAKELDDAIKKHESGESIEPN